MGQYRLWLHHRAIDQNLQIQYKTHKQELSEIDKLIARLEKTAMSTDNALLTVLMHQIKHQEHTTSKITDTTGAQPERNGIPQENPNGQKYQAPPPSNYGQQGRGLRTTDPLPSPQTTHVSPELLAWSHRPNFATQDRDISEEQFLSADATPILPATTDHLLPNDLTAFLDQEPQENRQPPWWLRNLMQSPGEEQEAQQTTPIDQQSRQTNQRVEHWFARRARLVHFDE